MKSKGEKRSVRKEVLRVENVSHMLGCCLVHSSTLLVQMERVKEQGREERRMQGDVIDAVVSVQNVEAGMGACRGREGGGVESAS